MVGPDGAPWVVAAVGPLGCSGVSRAPEPAVTTTGRATAASAGATGGGTAASTTTATGAIAASIATGGGAAAPWFHTKKIPAPAIATVITAAITGISDFFSTGGGSSSCSIGIRPDRSDGPACAGAGPAAASGNTEGVYSASGKLAPAPGSTVEGRPDRRPSTAPSAAAVSAAVAYRPSGSLSRSLSVMASSSGEIDGSRARGASGAVNMCIAMISPAPSATNGGAPTSSSYRMHPSEYRSARASMLLAARACSGAM